ncbi:MAG: endonuclease [Candidatus Hydrogenedens sp.]|nr:endonuclease [Candidatus Hydrogenedens sp.]
MRICLYNIRYGTGTGPTYHVPVPFSGFWRPTSSRLNDIIAFLRTTNADIVGLVEVDQGSYRTGRQDQAEAIAEALGYTHVYETKYAEKSLARNIPVMNRQGNALLTNQHIHAKGFHWFNQGMKRLVIELELENCVIYLVHLALTFRSRQYQLDDLVDLCKGRGKPVIVAGDFNTFGGDKELSLFRKAAGLANANTEGRPTWPANAPARQLDFILHSPEIGVRHFDIPRVELSDHLPLVCDFDLDAA